MSRKLRYIIIAAGFIVFVILAPLLVFYVRGLVFNEQNNALVQTGLFAIRTDPSRANVQLDGSLKSQDSSDIKFIKPGEYDITISKDGYFTWQKRLSIMANQVTWVNPAPNKLFLFLASTSPVSVSGGVKDFCLSGSSLIFLTNNALTLADANNLSRTADFPLPKTANALTVSPDGNSILMQNLGGEKNPADLVFSRASQSFFDITGIFSSAPQFSFSGNGALYARENSVLYKINLQAKTKTPVLSGIKAFAWLGSDLYYVQKTPAGNALFESAADGGSAQQLVAGIPNFSDGQIFVTQQKQIFLLADGSLYKMNGEAETLASGITDSQFDQKSGTLIFVHNGEVSNYNFNDQSADFVTRSDRPVSNPVLQQYTSMAFMARGNAVVAIELDTRDRQNEYDFYKGANLQKFMVDDSAKNLFVLDGGELKMLEIR